MKRFLLFVLAALCGVACTKEGGDLSISEVTLPEVITIEFDENDSRIQLQDGLSIWNKGDLVSVFYKSTENMKWAFEGETGDRSGTLRHVDGNVGTKVMDESVVVYPYGDYTIATEDMRVEGAVAATQRYSKDSYDPQSNIMVACSDNDHFVLKNICGWLRISLTGDGEVVKYISVQGNKGEQLAGGVRIDTTTADAQLIAGEDEAKSIKLLCEDGVTLGAEATDFYIALLPQQLSSGFTLTIKCHNFEPMTLVTDSNVSVVRNHIQPMANVEFSSTPRLDIEEEDSEPIFDSTITPYDGEKASDGGEEIIGSDPAIWWEAGKYDKRLTISYSAEGAAIVGNIEGVATYVDGGHVAIDVASTEGVEIVASGTCAAGSLKIYGKQAVKLLLGGLDLGSDTGAVINSQSKEPLFVVLGDETTNRLTDAKKYVDDKYYPEGIIADDEDRKGAIFAEGNIIISGRGVMVVESKKKHAIATDKQLTLRKGATVVITDSAKNGLHTKKGIEIMGGLVHATISSEAGKCIKTDGDVVISGGKLLLNTTGDAIYEEDENDTSSAACIKTDGNLRIDAGEIICKSSGMGGKGYNVDGEMLINGGHTIITTTGGKFVYDAALDLDSSPKGVKVEGNITINGGSFNISVTGKSEGSEGLESKSTLTINDGELYIYAYDDALNGGEAIVINGGNVYCYAINNDGIDSNGTMTINGGVVIASGCGAPEEGFDCDRSADFLVTGGVLIGTGGNAVEPNNSSKQNTLIYRGLNVQMDDNIAIVNESGEAVLLYTIPRSINGGMCLFFSSPDFAYGTYSIQKGVSFASSAEDWYGYWDTDEWSAGQELTTIEISKLITSYGSGGGPGGGGGWPGGGGGGWPGRP